MPADILIVEDDAMLREVLVEALAREGYVVRSAPDGLAALELLERGPLPALMFVDLHMPVMSGEQLVAAMRQRPALAGVPVVVVSAEVNAATIAARLGALGMLRKPVNLDAMLAHAARVRAGDAPTSG